MRSRQRVLLISVLAVTPLTAATAQVAGGPGEAIVRQLVVGNRTDITFNWVRIGPGHRANVREASYLQTDLGQVIYPVRVSFTATNGMYVRDTISTYAAFHNRIRGGAWDLSSNAAPGDKLNVLRP